MKRKFCWGLALLLTLLFPLTALADAIDPPEGEIVVSLGGNLDEKQQRQILELFDVKAEDVTILKVSIDEERAYLRGLVSDEKIGSRSISSAYVEPLGEGNGIDVETYNITWVTREMYANAMVTAGIENAKIIAAAPFNVSGTAALTGIMKAFEVVSGEELSEDAKQVANEELITTGELGESIGKDEAAALIKEIKEKVVKEKIKDEEEIKKIIIEIAGDLNIKLDQSHIDKIAELMGKIGSLDLNVEKIAGQIEKIAGNLENVKRVVEENKGVIKKILEAIENFFAWVKGFFE